MCGPGAAGGPSAGAAARAGANGSEETAMLPAQKNDTPHRADDPRETSAALDHSLVEHLPINIFRKDREGRFTFVNPRCAEAFGLPAARILGKTYFDLF